MRAAIASGHMGRGRLTAFVGHEAWAEWCRGLRGGLVPLIFIGLTAYLLMVLSNAGYMRDMNAADVPRNAPMLVYLLTPGDSLFLFFAWAWVFSQPVVRDRQAQLHEVVLASPVPLPALMAARWLGAWGVALLLGASQAVGFVLAPLLEASGAVPAGTMGPTPWAALAWAWLIYIVPLSAGCGALFLVAALRTRSTAGPFGVAALLCVSWMLAVVIIKDGHISPFLGALLDPSGFGEAERQVLEWTPQQKRSALIEITPGFALNRLVWGLLPVLWLAAVLRRLTRECLVLEAPTTVRPSRSKRPSYSLPASEVAGAPLPDVAPAWRWWRVLHCEAGWQLTQVLRSRGAWIGSAMLTFMGVLGAFFHIVGHAEGPMVPRPELLGPLLLKFTFLVIVFLMAALVGVIARRDDRSGFVEMVDAAPIPVAVRWGARCMAVAVVALLLVLLVAVASMLTTALAAPQHLSLVWAAGYQVLVHLPALMEVAMLTLLIHAVVRHAGMAYSLSMLLMFVLIVNHEAGLVNYPLYEFGMPVHVAVSGATGWRPWLPSLLTTDAFKLCVALAVAGVGALALQRGTDERWGDRARQAVLRLRGAAGGALVLGVAGAAGLSSLLHARFVEEGGWQSPTQARTEQALWEQRWLHAQLGKDSSSGMAAPEPGAQPFSVAGGDVRLQVDLSAGTVLGSWALRGVQAPSGWLHAELPDDFTLQSATVEGESVQGIVAHDHLALPLRACPPLGCSVQMVFTVTPRGWSAEGEPHWLLRDALWLRATDVLPRLGFDGDRLLRVPAERRQAGLAEAVRLPGYRDSVPANGVAPAGVWTWSVQVQGTGHYVPVQSGATQGAFDFAAVWSPRLHSRKEQGMDVLHDASRGEAAASVAIDVRDMQACVERRLGTHTAQGVLRQPVSNIVQAPRAMGGARVSGPVLWLPESPHWDVADTGVGRFKRRAAIAQAIAARHVTDAADLRQGPGGQWLAHGLPGALGLLCLAETDGASAAHAVMARASADITQALAGSTVPVGALSQAPFDESGWAAHYAPMAALDLVRRWDVPALQSLLAQARGEGRAQGDIAAVLAGASGAQQAAWALGPPLASDLQGARNDRAQEPHGLRWRWESGGWQADDTSDASWTLGVSTEGKALRLDAWPAYERAMADNWAPTAGPH